MFNIRSHILLPFHYHFSVLNVFLLAMGLCKCPKRKVTNLFCFEHRVNVCESCLLSNHDSCVVQTYLSWLTDSDYDANCLLCFESLNSKETLRLKCLHLFHWDCFDSRARQLPQTTAPAGYKCPSCLECVFPSENQSSPVVDKLRTKLQTVNWGRFGLGLSSIPELEQNALATKAVETNSSANNRSDGIHHYKTPVVANSPKTSKQIAAHDDPFEVNTFTARSKFFTDSGGNVSSRVNIGNEDDSKYVKAAAAERNIRNRFSRLPRSLKRVLLALIVVTFLYVIFGLFISGHDSSQGQNAGEDTLFDPLANPNIKVRAER